jgi:hypothetical protein
MELHAYEGRCHCGAIGFVYRTGLPGERWSVRACQCTFCRAHDALSTSDPQGALEFHAGEPELLQRYRFGQRTADFLLCRRCGVYIGVQMETDGGVLGVINIHALREPPPALPAATAMSYEGESRGERGSRRAQRWTPVTRAA